MDTSPFDLKTGNISILYVPRGSEGRGLSVVSHRWDTTELEDHARITGRNILASLFVASECFWQHRKLIKTGRDKS